MKRKALALLLISVLLLLVFTGTWLVNLTEATQPEIEYKTPPIISIHSPANNDTFTVNTVPVSFSITKPENWLIHGGYEAQQILKSVNYQLDGEYSDHILVNSTLESPFDCSLDLENMTDGVHSLKVFAYASGWVIQLNGFYEYEVPINSSSEIIYFTVIRESSEPTTTPPPTPPKGEGMLEKQLMDLIIGGIAGAVAIAVLVLLYYITKRK